MIPLFAINAALINRSVITPLEWANVLNVPSMESKKREWWHVGRLNKFPNLSKAMKQEIGNWLHGERLVISVLAMMVITMQLVDAGMTVYAIESGIGIEANPLLSQWVGSFWFWAAKLFVPMAIVAWCIYRYNTNPARVKNTLILLVLMSLAVVIWNASVIAGVNAIN